MRYYREQEVACLAKREGNSKRGYLYVNPLQGKHMPTRGAKLSVLIKDLKSLTDSCCGEDNCLCGNSYGIRFRCGCRAWVQ